MTNKILNIDQIRIVKTLFFVIMITILLYFYMVLSVVFNTSQRTEYIESISVLKSEIGQLEGKLMDIKMALTIDIAEKYNLVKSDKELSTIYIGQDILLSINEQ